MLALGVASVLIGAIIVVNNNTKQTEIKYRQKVRQLENQTKMEHNIEVQNLKKQLEEQKQETERVRQSKAKERARIAAVEAAKKPVVSKVVQSIVPTAQASTGSHIEWMQAAGISPADYQYVEFIVQKESGWNPNAVNRSSGSCGLGQQLPCGKWAGAWNDPIAALRAMNGYVARYNGWAGAYQFWLSHHWY